MGHDLPIQAGRLRAIVNTNGKTVAIVALTANDFSADRDRSIAAAMHDFIAKPVDAEQFYKTLLKWLSR